MMKGIGLLFLLVSQYVSSGSVVSPHSGGACSLSGMAATYDFSACTPGTITTATDSTGSNNGTAAGAGTVTCIASQQNGLSAISVTGNAYFSLASNVACTTTCTMYVVFKPTTVTANNPMIGSTTASVNTALTLLLPDSSGNVYLGQQQTANVGNSTGTLTNNTWVRVAVGYTGGTASFFIGGTASGTASGAVTITNGPNTILNGVNGGTPLPTAFQGEVGELDFATNAYNSANYACLGTKWAL